MAHEKFQPNITFAEAAYPVLTRLYRERNDLFVGLFALNRSYRCDEFKFEIGVLEQAGLCIAKAGMVTARCRVTQHQKLFVVSDTPDYFGNDRVWYPLADESLLFASLLPNCDGQRVLDIGCGSGILALAAAANGARSVLAIDVSPRAVAFTTFNALLNGHPNVRAEVIGLDQLSDPQPFDRILLNPPFVPVPDDTAYMLSGYGGRDGLLLPHLLFQRLPAMSHSQTAINVISMSPGDEYMSVLERMFLATFAARPVKILVTDIYASVVSIETALAPFRDEKAFAAWAAWLADRNYTHLHYLLIDAFPSDRFYYARRHLVPPLEDKPESGTWGAMYRVISNTKRHAR